jgi:hypothetical protein
MKIQLSREDACKIIRSYHGLPDNAEVMIEEPVAKNPSSPQLNPIFDGVVRKIDEEYEKGVGKRNIISMVMEWRILTGCSLKEGRDVIESWQRAREAIYKYGTVVFPHVDELGVIQFRPRY